MKYGWLLLLTVLAGSCFAQQRHPEWRGLLASPGMEGQPLKAVYFFPGEATVSLDKYTAHPTLPDDMHWNSDPGSRGRVLNRMTAAGVNTVAMSYWSNMPQWSPMQLDNSSWAGLLDGVAGRRLSILPAIEAGFDKNNPSIPHWEFKTDFPHPPGSSALAPGLVQRIGWLADLFRGHMNLWTQMYDRDGTPRYVVNILHVCSDVPGLSDEQFARAFEQVATQVRNQFHFDVGFTLDGIGGSYNYVLSPARSGPVLARQPSVVAMMGYESEVFSGKVRNGPPCADPDWRKCHPYDNNASNLPVLADWKKAAVHDWVASGLPVILDVSNGFDGRKVWQKDGTGFWGDNLDRSDDRWRNWMSELKGGGVTGIVVDDWNGYTEGYADVPTVEHGSIVYSWLTDLLDGDPRVCSHMHYVNGMRTFRVYGAICDKWVQLGADRSFGPPVSNEAASGHGRVSLFADGKAIYWSGATNAHEVHGLIAQAYFKVGADRSCLGLPTSDEGTDGGGRVVRFEHGTITWKQGDVAGRVTCR